MKITDILSEDLSRVPAKPNQETDPMLQTNRTAIDVVYSILGDRAVDADEENITANSIVVSRSWTGYDLFSDMDSDPGTGGAIGLVDLYGRTAKAIATAALRVSSACAAE